MASVSVLIPLYNSERYIGDTIRSVQAQTFTDWELIVVDDRSTDGSLAIAQQYARQDARIRVYPNPENLGMMRNWNHGLTYCTGTYFTKLDCDDLWEPAMLQTSYDILQRNPVVGMVFSRYRRIDADGKALSEENRELPAYARNASFTGQMLVKRGTYGMFADNVMKQGIGLIRRSIFDELGPFSLHDSGDTEMWFRIAAHYRVHGIDEVYYAYRIWPENFTRARIIRLGKQERNLSEVRAMIQEYYFRQGLITPQEYKNFKKDNLFELDKTRVYTSVQQRQWGSAARALASNIGRAPLRTCGFYAGRLWQRVTGKELFAQS